MIRLLTVGISSYLPTEHQQLAVSTRDAKEVHAAFTTIFGSQVDATRSVVALDITSATFLAFLEYVVDGAAQAQAQPLLYFSGHATIEEDVLTLRFADSHRTRGQVTTREIDEVLRKSGRPEVVLILDCCYSGSAVDLASSRSAYYLTRTSVLSSSGPVEAHRPGDAMSAFTTAVIQALNTLEQQQQPVSVGAVHELVKRSLAGSDQHPTVFIRDGVGDVVLKVPGRESGALSEVIGRFVETLANANSSEREMLWYTLDSQPEGVLLGTMEEVGRHGLHEPAWLVRRAMGSGLAGVRWLVGERRAVCQRLVKSRQWMEVCVGLIGSRWIRNDTEIDRLTRQVLIDRDGVADASWLALLYLADRLGPALLELPELWSAPVLGSAWGVGEMWERAIAPPGGSPATRAMATEAILARLNNPAQVTALVTHVALVDPEVFGRLSPAARDAADWHVLQHRHLTAFASSRQRGIGDSTGARKWLESKLYGPWRGKLQMSMQQMLSTLSPSQGADFLRGAAKLPLVASRMAIFESIADPNKLPEVQVEALSWGFADAHPWVRRTALEWLSAYPTPKNAGLTGPDVLAVALQPSDRKHWPGMIDLLLTGIRVARRWDIPETALGAAATVIHGLSPAERSAVERTVWSDAMAPLPS